MMVCDCREFYDNMLRIDCAVASAWVHGVKLGDDYVPMRFCPWCGKGLHSGHYEVEEEVAEHAVNVEHLYE